MAAQLFAPSTWIVPFHIRKAGWIWPILSLAFGVRLYGWGWGLAAGVLLFACLLLHEVGHMVAAWALGVPVREFGLCLLGAYNRRGYSTRRRDEIYISLAGPLMNILLAFVLVFVPRIGFMVALCSLELGIVNLIPLPSSDGLRIVKNLFGSTIPGTPVIAEASVSSQ
jgi:stage IV sporulation protein FB